MGGTNFSGGPRLTWVWGPRGPLEIFLEQKEKRGGIKNNGRSIIFKSKCRMPAVTLTDKGGGQECCQ